MHPGHKSTGEVLFRYALAPIRRKETASKLDPGDWNSAMAHPAAVLGEPVAMTSNLGMQEWSPLARGIKKLGGRQDIGGLETLGEREAL